MLVGSRNSSTECASASLLRRVSSRTRSRRFNCNSDGRLVKKIRDSSIGRYPYMLVVGDREEETGTIAVRSHEDGDLGEMTAEQFAARIRTEAGEARGPS